jgi:signal peptidase I
MYVLGVVAATAALAVAAVLVRRRFVLVTVHGVSMTPTFAPGDRLLARRCSPLDVRVGQVVVLRRPPTGPGRAARHKWIIKRIAATAGDSVEPHWLPPSSYAPGERVPAGMLVVLGDFADSSHDSRYWGYFPAAGVLATVVRRIR